MSKFYFFNDIILIARNQNRKKALRFEARDLMFLELAQPRSLFEVNQNDKK
jgi:hypothetical protein